MENNKKKQQTKVNHLQNSSSYINNGLKQMADYNFSEAISEFDKAIAINPKQLKAYYKKGLCFYNMEKFDEAMKEWDIAWSLEFQK